MLATIQFTMSAAEVNKRVVFVDGVPTLVKASTVPPGMIPFATRLPDMLRLELPGFEHKKSSGFRSISGGRKRAYFTCQHRKAHNVSFRMADVQADTPLTFDVAIKCHECNGTEQQPFPGHENQPGPSHQPPEELPTRQPPQELPTLTFGEDDSVYFAYANAVANLSGVLKRTYGICMASANPERALIQNQERFGQLLLDAWNVAVNHQGNVTPPNDVRQQRDTEGPASKPMRE